MNIATQLTEKINEAITADDLNKLLKKGKTNQIDMLVKTARAILKQTDHPLAVLSSLTTADAEDIIRQYGTPQDKKMLLK